MSRRLCFKSPLIIIINPNLLLRTKLTKKSNLQLISLKKLFSQSTIYIIPFDLKKKHLFWIKKFILLKIYHTFEKNSIKKGLISTKLN